VQGTATADVMNPRPNQRHQNWPTKEHTKHALHHTAVLLKVPACAAQHEVLDLHTLRPPDPVTHRKLTDLVPACAVGSVVQNFCTVYSAWLDTAACSQGDCTDSAVWPDTHDTETNSRCPATVLLAGDSCPHQIMFYRHLTGAFKTAECQSDAWSAVQCSQPRVLQLALSLNRPNAGCSQ
jgi:hypothetical protein